MEQHPSPFQKPFQPVDPVELLRRCHAEAQGRMAESDPGFDPSLLQEAFEVALNRLAKPDAGTRSATRPGE